VVESALGIDRRVTSANDGEYKSVGLPAGVYTVTTSKTGFVQQTVRDLELTLNRTVNLNFALKLGGQSERVEVSDVAPLLDSTTSRPVDDLPEQIEQMPINGRNYLDLLQLVPGVAIKPSAGSDARQRYAHPGRARSNAVFLIDGMPNRDEVNGGAAAQFNQDSILNSKC